MRARPEASRKVGHLERVRNVLVVVFLVTLLVALVPGSSDAAPVPGGSGTDTTLAPTSSQATVNGRGPFEDLAVTVNQTENLGNQAISVSWTGGTPTVQSSGRFGADFLQVFQCWGDDDGLVPENPGPPPEQCEAGGVASVYGGIQESLRPLYPSGLSTSRVISRTDWPNYDASVGALDQKTGYVWRPFRAVDGSEIGVSVDSSFNPSLQGGSYWRNPYFDSVTTNEIAGAATDNTGKGSELFQVNTGIESRGLGCGQKVEPVEGGGTKIPQCWLVVVPRGEAATENAGTSFDDPSVGGVSTSPLADDAWANRIAIPLEFNPVDSPCAIGAKERRLAGSELLVSAISSWQPSLCAAAGGPPYIYNTIADDNARQQIVRPSAGSPGLVVTPSPIDPAEDDPASPTVYAPLTVSGVTIAFNIERTPRLDAPDDEQALSGVRVENLNLTPRIVAKLLTQSYTRQIDVGNSSPGYPWAASNPSNMLADPDFLQFNEEFEMLRAGNSKNTSGAIVPIINSDATRMLWRWILADPEAKAWLDGEPDPWGMAVNPIYATTAAANSSGVPFATEAPNSFPKGDPYCYQSPLVNGVVPPLLCGPDWLPYSTSYRDSARAARIADDGAKTTQNAQALSSDQVWKRDGPQAPAFRSILAVTDTPSADKFGLQQARLSRAGDDGADRQFVAPDAAGLEKGVEAMKAGAVASVLEPDPLADVAGAYPLTAVTYGALRPLDLDAEARAEYADLIEYAVGAGQVPGLEPGQLPLGYAALPDSLVQQSVEAAATVRTLEAAPEPTQPGPPAAPPTAPAVATGSPQPSSAAPSPTRSKASAASVEETPAPEQVVAVEQAAAASTPEAGPLTPLLALARSRFFIPFLSALAVISTLLALEVTKRPRRAAGRAQPVEPGAAA